MARQLFGPRPHAKPVLTSCVVNPPRESMRAERRSLSLNRPTVLLSAIVRVGIVLPPKTELLDVCTSLGSMTPLPFASLYPVMVGQYAANSGWPGSLR